MSETTTATPTAAAIHERWEADTPVKGDYLADCVEFAREALAHAGFDRFEESPWADVIECRDGEVPVTVAVMALPPERWETTLDDLGATIDDDVRAHGAALCLSRAALADGPMPGCARFDVVSVCVNLAAARVRIHHVRGAWQS